VGLGNNDNEVGDEAEQAKSVNEHAAIEALQMKFGLDGQLPVGIVGMLCDVGDEVGELPMVGIIMDSKVRLIIAIQRDDEYIPNNYIIFVFSSPATSM
jgi:hypothetical protein